MSIGKVSSLTVLIRSLKFSLFTTPMVVKQDEMTDSEIIDLLSEYKFKEAEMSKILKELKARDFESVLAFIEERRKNQGSWKDDDREKMVEELKKRKDIQRMETERNERYRKLLKEKIAANREEQRIREEQENKQLKIEERPVQIDADVKVRVYLENAAEVYLGFGKDATIKDLYEKIASVVGTTNFQISRFGHEEGVSISNKSILEEFKAKSVMLELLKN